MRISGLRVLAAVGLVALALTACGNNPTTQQKLSGGTATFAEAPSAKPNYIFPLASGGVFSVANLSQCQFLMYMPLKFGNTGKRLLYKQLHMRQALQPLVDQDSYIKNIFTGFAYPDYGPVPI